ncbi:MAG: MarR family transcriptional regulator [Methanotrichaceae archaeon]
MRENNARVLEERDKLFIDILWGLGIRKHEATIIIWMNGAGEVSSKDIENGTGIRQSEVSKVLKTMRELGWVDNLGTNNSTKGRPRKIYTLSASLNDIVTYYELQKLGETTLAKDSIQRLKELAPA